MSVARASLGTLITALLTAVLLLVGSGLLALDGATGPADAFFDEGPRAAAGIAGIPFLVWVVVLAALDVLNRGRRPVVRILLAMAATVVIAVISTVFWAVIGFSMGGWGALLVALAAVYLAIFSVAGLVSLLITHLLVLRRGTAAPTPGA